MYQIVVMRYGKEDTREVVDIEADGIGVDAINDNGYTVLKLYKGGEMIAAFNEWIYVRKLDGDS